MTRVAIASSFSSANLSPDERREGWESHSVHIAGPKVHIHQNFTSEGTDDLFNILGTDEVVIIEVVDSEGIGGLQVPGSMDAEDGEHVQEVFKVEAFLISGKHLTEAFLMESTLHKKLKRVYRN